MNTSKWRNKWEDLSGLKNPSSRNYRRLQEKRK